MSVKFSPFNQNLMAFCTADNFGVVGKGKLFILELTPDEQVKVVRCNNIKF